PHSPRCLHGPWRAAGDPAAPDDRRETRGGRSALVLAWAATVCWSRPQARCYQVALRDRRVHARIRLDQGRPLAPPDPARHDALEAPLPPPRVRRIERVRLHADLTILSQLACALSQTRVVALAA